VPDWRVWSDDSDYLFLAKWEECQYQASLESQPKVSFGNDKRILGISGVLFDRIRAVTASNPGSLDHTDAISVAIKEDWEFWQRERPSVTPYGDEAAQALAFERGLFLGRDRGWITKPTMTRTYIGRAAKALGEDADAIVFPYATEEEFNTHYLGEELSDASRAALYRKLFITEGGYMGYGLKGIEAGDVVVVLLGARVPFVLQPTGDSHVLRGDCCEYSSPQYIRETIAYIFAQISRASWTARS
jgi:hypothetical protein